MSDQGEHNSRMVRYMVLADAVQAVDGKHYILGGGFNTIFAGSPTPPIIHNVLAIALRIDIPWKATTPAAHTLELDIVDSDGHSILQAKPEVKFEAGRPPGMRSDDSSVMNIALNLGNLSFPDFGVYRVICRIDGNDEADEKLIVARAQPGMISPAV